METKSTLDKKLMTINLRMDIDYIDIELNRNQLTSNRHRIDIDKTDDKQSTPTSTSITEM